MANNKVKIMKTLEELNMQIIEQSDVLEKLKAEKDKVEKLSKNYIGRYIKLIDENGDFGVEDYFNKDGVCIIEWSELIEDRLPEERLDINIKIVDENTRLLVFKPYGDKYEELCNAVL